VVRGDRAAAACWTASARSSPASRAWWNGSSPPWTASTPPSFPTTPSTSCRCRPGRQHPHRRGRPQQGPHPRRARGRACARPAPGGFTAAQLAAKVQAITGQTDRAYTTRQAAYDLKKLRGNDLVVKLGTSRRYHAPPGALRTITALLVLRDQVITPILAGVRVPRRGRKPATWTRTDQHYETRRLQMNALFSDCGIAAQPASQRQHLVDPGSPSP
jgi:hypothetical protein